MTYGIVIAVLILALLATVIAVVVQTGSETDPEHKNLAENENDGQPEVESISKAIASDESFPGLDEQVTVSNVVAPDGPEVDAPIQVAIEYPEATNFDDDRQAANQSPVTTEELFDPASVSADPLTVESVDVEEINTGHAEGIPVVSEEADRDPGTVRVRATRRRRVADGSGDVR